MMNDKTNIFPISNGVDFLGYHHYLTESGAVVQKLRQSSVKKVKQRIKDWRYLYENHLISAQDIKASFLAWDAFAAYGDTYELRRKLADKVEGIIRDSITIHRKYNSTRLQREARRQKQERHIAENRRRRFEKDSIESGSYIPEAFNISSNDSDSSIDTNETTDVKSSMPYISNVLTPISDDEIVESYHSSISRESILEKYTKDHNNKTEMDTSVNKKFSDYIPSENQKVYDDYLNTPPWEERT